MRRCGLIAVVLFLSSWFGLPSALAQAPLWTEPPLSDQLVVVRDKTVVFPDATGKLVTLEEAERAFLSPRGDRCFIYNHGANTARVFDSKGTLLTQFATDQGYAGVQVSNSGLIAFSARMLMHSRTDYVVLHDPQGAELWRTPERTPPGFLMTFSPDGELLAVLRGTEDPDGVEALLYNRAGDLWAHRLGPGTDPGGIAFDHQGRRIAFIENRGGASVVHLWDSRGSTWTEVSLEGRKERVAPGNVAFSPDDSRLVLSATGRVEAYDRQSGILVWSRDLNGPDRTQDLLDAPVRLLVIGDRVAVSHLISAPLEQMKYAVSFLDLQGNMVGEQYMTGLLPRRADPGRFWDVVDQGASLLIHAGPAPAMLPIP